MSRGNVKRPPAARKRHNQFLHQISRTLPQSQRILNATPSTIAYFDCHCGIAGDMTLAAMIDLGVPAEAMLAGVRSLGIPDLDFVVTEVKKNGFRAVHVDVTHPPEHAHRHLHHIHAMIDAANDLDDAVRQRSKAIFGAVAVAEAKVHGSTIEKVHFHEVGAVDSIADIVGVAIGWQHLGIDRAVASAIPTGTGKVTIAHGNVSVPAPATLEILRGVPIETCDIPAELTTPTGAAIVASQCESFGPMPSMTIDRMGYGAGTMDIKPRANVLRIVLGRESHLPHLQSDRVTLIQTNIDDCSAEQIAVACEKSLLAGALDVWQTPCTMKKGRAGIVLSLLCDAAETSKLERVIFQHTTAIGVRRTEMSRSKLARQAVKVTTQWGEVAAKELTLPDGATRLVAENDSVAKIAAKSDVSAIEVRRAVEQSTSST